MQVFKSNNGQEFIILSRVGKKCMIQFLETNSLREVYYENLKEGKVKDLYHKSVYGVGYQGDFIKVEYWREALQLWRNMMKRCYSNVDEKGYKFKKGTVVAPRWLEFAKFLEDLPKLENFDKWLKGGNCTSTRYQLDKDLLFPDANVYSPQTCMFITEHENKKAGAINARKFDKRYYKANG